MSEEFKPKRYACVKWPFLRIGSGKPGESALKFNAGFFTAQDEREVGLVEKNEAYGIHIHPVQWEPSKTPSKPGKVQELIQEEIESALAANEPKARRGARGSR